MLISIIVPVYNGGELLKKLLVSCLSQTIDDFEVIVINDGSIDGTLDYLEEQKKIYHSKLIIINSEQEGVFYARKKGILKAQGEYIFFADADDLLPENTLINMCKHVSNADIVCGNYQEIDIEDNIYSKVFSLGVSGTGQDFLEWIWHTKRGYLWGKIIKKELLLNNLEFPEILDFCEDLLMITAMSIGAKNVIHLDNVVYLYRKNPLSVCHRKDSVKKWCQRYRKIAVNINFLLKKFTYNEKVSQIISEMMLFYCCLYLCWNGSFDKNDKKIKNQYKELLKDMSFCKKMKEKSPKILFLSKLANYFPFLLHSIYYFMLKFVWKKI